MTVSKWLLLVACVAQVGVIAEDKPPAQTSKQSTGTAIGVYMGEYWKSRALHPEDFDLDAMAKAFEQTLSQETPPLSQKEVNDTLTALGTVLRTRRLAQRAQLAANNLKQSTEFLNKNKSEPGVHVLPNGVQYKVLQEGSGPHPKSNEFVIAKYRGTLLNGKEFDSSKTRNTSNAPVPLNAIVGCAEALQHMSPGAKWQVFVPPAQGHGERGLGGLVPPNSVLIYDLELVSIQQPPPTPPDAAAPVGSRGGGQFIPVPPSRK